MGQKAMGWERGLFYGVAGSTAATRITRARDVTYEVGKTDGETTSGGDGSSPPIEVFRTASLTARISWQMVRDAADTTLTSLLAAARTGAPVAIRYIPVTGALGFDGDVILTASNGAPYKGEQTIDFEAVPNDDLRTPLLNA